MGGAHKETEETFGEMARLKVLYRFSQCGTGRKGRLPRTNVKALARISNSLTHRRGGGGVSYSGGRTRPYFSHRRKLSGGGRTDLINREGPRSEVASITDTKKEFQSLGERERTAQTASTEGRVKKDAMSKERLHLPNSYSRRVRRCDGIKSKTRRGNSKKSTG